MLLSAWLVAAGIDDIANRACLAARGAIVVAIGCIDKIPDLTLGQGPIIAIGPINGSLPDVAHLAVLVVVILALGLNISSDQGSRYQGGSQKDAHGLSRTCREVPADLLSSFGWVGGDSKWPHSRRISSGLYP